MTMGALARSVGIAMVGAACACNALTGADALDADPSGEATLPTRRHETSSAPIGETSSSSSSSGSSSGTPSDPESDAGEAADAGSDAPVGPNPNVFFDDFQRAESPSVGNGWLEKLDKFAIVGGAVRQAGIGPYRDMLVKRPASEDLLDVEIRVDVTHEQEDGDPALVARMQPASNNPDTLVGYTFYAYYDYVFLDRDEGGKDQYTELASQAISPPLPSPYTYSMSLKVTGTNPVVIVATVKDAGGNVKAMLTFNDASAERIASPGGVAFGSGDADGARFDNFERTKL